MGYGAKREAFKEQLSKATYKEALIYDWRDLKASWSEFCKDFNEYLILAHTDVDPGVLQDQLYKLNIIWREFNKRLIFFWTIIRPHINIGKERRKEFSEVVYNLFFNLSKPDIIDMVDDFFIEIEREVTPLISLSDTFTVRLRT